MKDVVSMETVNGLPHYPVAPDQLGLRLTIDDMRQGITATARFTTQALRAADIAAIGYGHDVMDRTRTAYPELYEEAMVALETDKQEQASRLGQLALHIQKTA